MKNNKKDAINEFSKIIKDKIPIWRENPVLFAKEVCGFVPADEVQHEFLMSLVTNDKILVAAGRNLGKSVLAALASLWFVTCFYNPIVLVTSPNFQQLMDVLFAEITTFHKKSPLLRIMFDTTKRTFRHKEYSQSWQIVLKTAQKGGGMRGYNRPNKFYIIDEATEVDDEIIQALLGSTDDKNAKVLMITNPTRLSGVFFQLWHDTSKDGRSWKKIEIDRMTTGIAVIELIAGKEKAEAVRERLQSRIDSKGEDHDEIRIEIRGKFPLSDNKLLISPHLLDDTNEKETELKDEEIVSCVLGVDIAGSGGDSTVFALNRMNYDFYNPQERLRMERPIENISISRVFGKAEYTKTRAELVQEVSNIVRFNTETIHNDAGQKVMRNPKFKQLYVQIDATGVGDEWSDTFVEQVKRDQTLYAGSILGKWVTINKVKFQAQAEEKEHYVNRRAEMGEQLRHKLEGNKERVIDGLPPSLYFVPSNNMSRGLRELTSIEKELGSNGRVKLEEKIKLKKRIGGSPDMPDAIMLAHYVARPKVLIYMR